MSSYYVPGILLDSVGTTIEQSTALALTGIFQVPYWLSSLAYLGLPERHGSSFRLSTPGDAPRVLMGWISRGAWGSVLLTRILGILMLRSLGPHFDTRNWLMRLNVQ